MDTFRRLALPFWVVAMLLWTGLSAAHAAMDSFGGDSLVACIPAEVSEHSDPSSEASPHHCCPAFADGLISANCSLPPRLSLFFRVSSLGIDPAPDSPVREIEYPPQLS